MNNTARDITAEEIDITMLMVSLMVYNNTKQAWVNKLWLDR